MYPLYKLYWHSHIIIMARMHLYYIWYARSQREGNCKPLLHTFIYSRHNSCYLPFRSSHLQALKICTYKSKC